MERNVNKILLYIGLAILLGTVTMVAPLALLGPEDSITEPKDTLTVPEAAEPSDQQRASENGGTLESGDLPTEMWAKPAAPVEPEPPAVPEPAEPSPQEAVLAVKTADNASDLSPIGLMVIPSFLVALGVFVYLRKRMG